MEQDTREAEALNEASKLETVVTTDKSKSKKKKFAIMGVTVVLVLVVLVGIFAVGGNSGKKLQEQLDLGNKYLDEMDYERALVAFNAVLKIDPKNADAYLGIVEVYIRTNDFEAALETAREGYEATGDERLKEKIDMIESGDIFASNGWQMKMSGYDGEGNLVFWHEYTYNLKGQMASVTKYNADGVQEQYFELTYDEEGRIVIGCSTGSKSGEISKVGYEYGDHSIRHIWYEGISDRVKEYAEEELDDQGHTLKTTRYNAEGEYLKTKIYTYDEAGRVAKQEDLDKNGELLYYYVRLYDQDGKMIQSQHFDAEGNLTSYFEYIYDEEGKRVCDRCYDRNGVLQYEHRY